MQPIPFDDYVASLGRLGEWGDPTAETEHSLEIGRAADALAALPVVDRAAIAAWVEECPQDAYVLALAVGVSREKFHNLLRHWFGSASWTRAASERPLDLVARLDEEHDLVRLITAQRHQSYTFGDILVARAGTRSTAASAGQSGRRLEDDIEAIARGLHLAYEVRTRFEGRNGRTAPADLAVPARGRRCVIAVAAKGFDSTGSKLSDAVREIEEMADARTGGQVALAVVDGIGWKGRIADLRRIWTLWDSGQIDGLYTRASLGSFREDLDRFATLRGVPRS